MQVHRWLSAVLLAAPTAPAAAQPQARSEPSTNQPAHIHFSSDAGSTKHQAPSSIHVAVSASPPAAENNVTCFYPVNAAATPAPRNLLHGNKEALAPADTTAATSRHGAWNWNVTEGLPSVCVIKAPSAAAVGRALKALLEEQASSATEAVVSSVGGGKSTKRIDTAGAISCRFTEV